MIRDHLGVATENFDLRIKVYFICNSYFKIKYKLSKPGYSKGISVLNTGVRNTTNQCSEITYILNKF